jgi:hypothetical protein
MEQLNHSEGWFLADFGPAVICRSE